MAKKIIFIVLVLFVLLLISFFFLIGGGFGNKQLMSDKKLDDTLLFAHRGIAVYYPENTGESLNAAKSSVSKGLKLI